MIDLADGAEIIWEAPPYSKARVEMHLATRREQYPSLICRRPSYDAENETKSRRWVEALEAVMTSS